MSSTNEHVTDVFYELSFSKIQHLRFLLVNGVKDLVKNDEILLCLKNVPVLKWLKLLRYPFKLEDLEVLHSSCPLLATLKIERCAITIEQDESLPTEMMAATTVTQLLIDYMLVIDPKRLFLTYLTRIYTNVINFDFYPMFSDVWVDCLFPNQITTEELSSNPEYNNSLKSLNLITRHLEDLVDLLTEKCHKLKHIGFHADYHSHDRALDVQKLLCLINSMPSLKSLWVAFNTSAQNHRVQHVSNYITELRTSIQQPLNYKDMDLGWMLSMFPSLLELEIKWSGVRLIINDSDPPKIYPNLVKLTIRPSETHPNLLKDIRARAPNLNHLAWSIVDSITKTDAQSRSFEPETIDGRSVYTINSDGFYLDIFHLNITLSEKRHTKVDGLVLEIIKGRIVTEFVISQWSKSISVVDYDEYSDEDEKLTSMTKVTIWGQNVKMIKINSDISIDVEEFKIQMEFS